MEEIGSILLSLKDKALDATKQGDEDFYRTYLAEKSISIIQSRIFNKEGFIKQISSHKFPFLTPQEDKTQLFILNDENGVVTYKATLETKEVEEGSFITFLITAIYSKINGCWQNIFYQQTPIHN